MQIQHVLGGDELIQPHGTRRDICPFTRRPGMIGIRTPIPDLLEDHGVSLVESGARRRERGLGGRWVQTLSAGKPWPWAPPGTRLAGSPVATGLLLLPASWRHPLTARRPHARHDLPDSGPADSQAGVPGFSGVPGWAAALTQRERSRLAEVLRASRPCRAAPSCAPAARPLLSCSEEAHMAARRQPAVVRGGVTRR
jgi:hypothetical protein